MVDGGISGERKVALKGDKNGMEVESKNGRSGRGGHKGVGRDKGKLKG